MRLMEQEGIAFFFRHEHNKHVLVLTDASVYHQPCPYQASVKYDPTLDSGFFSHEDTVSTWRREQEIRPSRYTLNDFNFETPSNSLLSSVGSQIPLGLNGKLEVFDYPGEYENRQGGEDWS
jgi:type VI secretion system secreted protein VgrG